MSGRPDDAEEPIGRTSPPRAWPARLARVLPVLDWGRRYDRAAFASDAVAAVIVTIMLIPQSLAYALLAGLPPEAGLYASVLPLVAYAAFGTSGALAVGPVAVVSLMTAAAIGALEPASPAEAQRAALTLALLSGAMLLAMGVFRLGFLARLLSHPVIAGFIAASGLLIATSQLKHLLGVKASGGTLPEMLASLGGVIGEARAAPLAVGLASIAFLVWSRKGLKPVLIARGFAPRTADLLAKAGPAAAVVATTLASWAFSLESVGVTVVGLVPQGLPPLTAPSFEPELLLALAPAAALISVIGFVESVSVAQTLAAKKRQRITPDQELLGLGAANVAASLSGGYPVTGGFARSVVNFDAGAETPAAGAFAAVGIALATLALTPLLYYLPTATLAATIVVAVLSLVDLSILRRAWRYSKADFAAVAATMLATLGVGVEIGVMTGVAVSLLAFLAKTARPHVAEVGLVPGTEHFRNIRRHRVLTSPEVLSLRVDESLYFANARFLEDLIAARVAAEPRIRAVVLQCSAVNEIDMSALESLEAIDRRLKEAGVALHLSEVKGPVMDRLARTDFLDHLSGRVFLTQYQAILHLDGARCVEGSAEAAPVCDERGAPIGRA